MGSATVVTLSAHEAREQLDEIKSVIGELDEARARSYAGLLSDEDEARLRTAEGLAWLLGER